MLQKMRFMVSYCVSNFMMLMFLVWATRPVREIDDFNAPSVIAGIIAILAAVYDNVKLFKAVWNLGKKCDDKIVDKLEGNLGVAKI